MGTGDLNLVRDSFQALNAFEAGIENVVAFLTEAISPQQLEQLAALILAALAIAQEANAAVAEAHWCGVSMPISIQNIDQLPPRYAGFITSSTALKQTFSRADGLSVSMPRRLREHDLVRVG